MDCAIHIDNLSKQFRDKRFNVVDAVRNVSLQVGAGESFGFVGPNGAGKSTTIKIMMGLSSPTSGSVSLFGRSAADHHARLGVGYVPENLYLYDYLTPLEFLLAGTRLHGVKQPDLVGHCMRWLDRFGVAGVARKGIRSFSKGMTQRVALAHALAVQPRLLVLDEPLSGLDPIGRKEVVDVLQEYRQQGGAIFFSSHILHDVERLADRFGIIHKGTLRTIQTPAELVGEVQEFWVRVAGTAPLPGAESEPSARWKIRVSQERLANVLGEINHTGQRLIAVETATTLEAAFMRYVQADK